MIDLESLDWTKMGGSLPAIVQDADSGEVRMLGYMDREALEATIRDRLVTFRSRSKGSLWRKGESSGNLLELCRSARTVMATRYCCWHCLADRPAIWA